MDKETSERLTKIEVDKRIEEGISAWIRTVCITATLSTWGFFMWLGSTVYDKFPAFKAAIVAFIITDKGLK